MPLQPLEGASLPVTFMDPWFLLLILPAAALVWFTRRRVRTLTRRRGRGAAALRLAALVALAAALAQPLVQVPDDRLSVAIALDVSDSIGPDAQAQVAVWLEEALRARGDQDVVAAAAFARDAHVLRPPTTGDTQVLPAVIRTDGTNLAEGLQLAAALAPGEGMRRVVLISDGWSTEGDLDQALESLEDVQLMVLPVPNGNDRPEVMVQGIQSPRYVRQGDELDTYVTIGSTEQTQAVLGVQLNGEPVFERMVTLRPGENTFNLNQTAPERGFHHLTATVQSPLDSVAANNAASSFMVVKDAPRLLVLEDRPDEAMHVQEVLASSGMHVDVMNSSAMPPLRELESYDAMVLGNVAATSFTLDQMQEITAFVESRGHGLITLGGPTTYALGGYGGAPLERALPVWANIPTKREGARIALLLIIDRSGSMDLRSEGVARMEMAKEAAILATESLKTGDIVGVLAFDMRTHWVVPLEPVSPESLPSIQHRIGQLRADGGTDIYTALRDGYLAMRGQRAELRHIVLLSDGQSWDAAYEELVAQMRAAGIGLSAIALGRDADTQLMARLARWGEGRYYFTERPQDLPQIVTKEAAIAKRTALVEGVIHPQLIDTSPILRSIVPAELPPLSGYIGTIPKETAQVVLATDAGEPLLVQWHFGLGRAVAWTSELGPRWMPEWLTWRDNPRFWSQMVRWVLPPPMNPDLRLDVSNNGNVYTVRAEALEDGSFVNLARTVAQFTLPDGQQVEMPMRQTAPGRYEVEAVVPAPGVYQVDVAQVGNNNRVARTETTGLVVREQPEMATFGANEQLLRRLASATGGRVIQRPEEAFARDFEPRGLRWEPLWWRLVLLALLLLVVEIAVRRLPWPPQRAFASLFLKARPV